MKLSTAFAAACLLICSLGVMPLHSSAGDSVKQPEIAQEQPASGKLSARTSAAPLADTIRQWQSVLAEELDNASWKTATWQSYPLGPGTHGWVVILSDQGSEVGYMIVHATEEGGYRLTEYGTGDHPLFSLNTLYQSLIQQELISSSISFEAFAQDPAVIQDRLYTGTLTSVWKLILAEQTVYADAKSGEILPLTKDPEPAADESLKPSSLTHIASQLKLPAFDPYDRLPWVQGTPLAVASLVDLQQALQKNAQLTYVTKLYGDQVTMPLAVMGYTEWEADRTYLVLDHNGPRYIPLPSALAHGSLYN
ncbi:hypothetical protein [Paenibacillus whitsoniae]|uniref:DUF4309 domain-containing protein n=1 Tax=Paenibacillus whitsoniae TaxID=2496558 RepID=A0A3S0CWI9_9BACL|nr:hypothetical protein [Paenibacillus whitsoniae]RTE10359.1 hypothetical protein EJQ19_07620 [Paenibacillus whitsoniae]